MLSRFFKRLPLRTKLVLFIGLLFSIPVVFQNLYINRLINKEYYALYAERVMDVARFTAASPQVIEALMQPGRYSAEELGRVLDILAKVTRLHFIVPMDMEGKRLYHPNHEKIGMSFVGGDEVRALRGETYISSAIGTLGPSQRAFVPVYAPDGKQIGAVSAGILSNSIDTVFGRVRGPLLQLQFLTLLAGLLLAALLAKSIKRILSGLEPYEIATLLKERSAMLHMMNEGVLAIGLDGRVTLVNDEAERILRKAGIAEPLLGKPLAAAVPGERLHAAMYSGVPEYEAEQTIQGVTVLASHMPVTVNSLIVGAISTFRDMSEVRQLAEKITDINRYVDALRSQSHEFMNKLHAILGLANSGNLEELKAYVTHIAGIKSAENKAIYDSVRDPVLAGFLESKYSKARECGVTISFDMRGVLPSLEDKTLVHSLITILGNLIDNGLDTVQQSERKELRVLCAVGPKTLEIAVSDTGSGIREEDVPRIFSKGYSSKEENRGIGLWLTLRAVDAMNGAIDVDSQPGEGTTFRVVLPRTGKPGEMPC